MDSNNLIQLLQKGFRVSLGATATLIEILQDPQKREQNLSKLQTELNQLSEEWAAKGEVTEQEARNFVDTILAKQGGSTKGSKAGSTTITTTATPVSAPDVQTELQELTDQIASIRSELEKLQEKDGDNP